MTESLDFPLREEADAKAWFYLDHRGDIETWAALRTDGAKVLESYLLALDGPLEDAAEALGAEPYRRDLETGSWPLMGWRRESWRTGEHADVTVALEWERSRLLSGRNTWPYVGVRLDPDHSDPVRRQAVAEALAGLRKEFTGRTATWPLYGYVVPTPGERGAVDPEALARAAWVRLNQLWHLAAPELDKIARALGDA